MNAPKNIAASIRQKLLERSRSDQRPFAELMQYFAMERFLYRLTQSAHSQCFILKGALMLRVWQAPVFRPTMDIDMLGRTSNDEASIISQIRDILNVEVAPDGLIFDESSVQPERITENSDYQGIRVRFRGTLASARFRMQIDIGFGDLIYPSPETAELPTILDFAAPKVLCYSRESAISEKFEAMIKLGALNSRMKDFYDVWLLSRQFNFKGNQLAQAVRLTFEQRNTPLPNEIVSFQPSFISEKQVQWSAFHRRLDQAYLPKSFADIVAHLSLFLVPVVESLRSSQPLTQDWSAAHGWR